MAHPPEPGPLGVFGGTFDPVHIGHLRLAEEAREALGLARVRWIPAGQPWHRAPPRTSPQHRLGMVRAAIAGNDAFEADGSEVAAGRPSYTVDTLAALRTAEGDLRPLVLILGTDAFSALHTWHRWRELFGLAHIGLASRAGQSVDALTLDPALTAELAARASDNKQDLRDAPAGRIVRFDMTPLAVSATDIRARLAHGASVRYLLPDAVLEYIRQQRLY
ncbi:nicotinate-nucleotide adenylyltransferase [Methyloversatilis thermotolerans]|uniref:nicotinate-nucleotide adenylyltransferase n=1 Tax=Methyloversatilis thermotolerans TaxID=1346290 RepID=UPI0003727560|nr:nicotinate-nucleotide adenylyltransferase [Methyloversatilis thermotolerans]